MRRRLMNPDKKTIGWLYDVPEHLKRKSVIRLAFDPALREDLGDIAELICLRRIGSDYYSTTELAESEAEELVEQLCPNPEGAA